MTFFKSYNRYMVKSLLGPFFFVILCLTGVLWLAQSLRFIDLIVNRGLPISTFLYLTLLITPSLLAVILPVALFVGVLFTYNRMIMESELVVLESAGLSKFKLATPALAVGVGAVIFGYILMLFLMPASYRAFKDLQNFIRNNYVSILLQEEVFNTPMEGLTVFIKERNAEGVLRGIFVHDNRDTQHPLTMIAQEGRLVKTAAGPRFMLLNGNRQEIDHEKGQLSLLHFESYALDISLYTKPDEIRSREMEERYFHELWNPDDTENALQRQRLRVEAHQRLTWPLYALAMTLIGLYGLSSGQFNRRGLWRRILGAGVFGMVFLGAAFLIRNLANQYPIAVVGMYANVILGIGIPLALILRQRAYRAVPRQGGRA